ncbi:Pentatricopeptide repeat-containing protein [Artemisia annua]|uniref:Pentatricopeptide repeat-containing protein n=1 Tax=Artemisia annua TaxID=35608 RepID=A0A2U1LS07_ARTAN|nr:Pentatricopeptide repeat-containing protein [Artemisia annua]
MFYTKRPLNYTTTFIHYFKPKTTTCPLCASFYNTFASIAHTMFDKIPKRNEPILRENEYEKLASYVQGNMLGNKPSKFELCASLNCCAKTRNLQLGAQFHAKVFHIGLDRNLYINSALVNVYAKCGAVSEAMRVFTGMEVHDEVSWTSMICGLSQNGHGRKALCLFKEMLLTLVRPNCFTYVSVISGCTEQESVFKCGELLHAHVVRLGHESNDFVISCLIDYYSKCGRMDKALMLFEACAARDTVLLNTMISAFSHNLQGEDALKLFMKMRNENVSLSEHALTSVLDACGALTVLEQGRQMHALVMKMGSDCNTFVVGALINMYSKCGNMEEARRVFDSAVYKNNILWTSMMTACAQNGRGLDALDIFDHLVTDKRFNPDHVCFTAVLTACNHSGLLDKGISYFEKMTSDYNLAPEIDQYACLIDLYARKGDLKRAKKVMDEMPFTQNAVMWSSFLSSCKEYGNVELGREAAFKLFELEPDSPVPYLILADIYGSAGLWNEVHNLRKMMNESGIRKSLPGWSWVEVDNDVHVFSVGDSSHPRSEDIRLELRKLSAEMLNERTLQLVT